MSSTPREPLRHILDEIDFLVEQTRGLTKEEFLADPLRRRAFVRSLEIIGEAVKRLPVSLKARYPNIQWSLIAGMRDHLIHGYFSVDYDIVWDAATTRVRDLQTDIRWILDAESS